MQCMVVIEPCTMPTVSFTTLATGAPHHTRPYAASNHRVGSMVGRTLMTGAMQFVVQLAAVTTSIAGSYLSWLQP